MLQVFMELLFQMHVHSQFQCLADEQVELRGSRKAPLCYVVHRTSHRMLHYHKLHDHDAQGRKPGGVHSRIQAQKISFRL